MYNSLKMISTVDYTLKKRATLRDLRAGRMSRWEACDAHPEMRRIARLSGEATAASCPICGKLEIRHLHFVYGDELGPSSGRVYPSRDVRDGLYGEYSSFICYVVEVCTACCWNHLVRSLHFESNGGNGQAKKEARQG